MGIPAALSAQNEINEYLNARLSVIEAIIAETHPQAFPIDYDNISAAEIESSGLSTAAKARVTTEGRVRKDKVKAK